MGLIGIDELTFYMTVQDMKLAGNAINGSIGQYENKKARAFSLFLEEYVMLQKILKSYRELVLKDTETIKKVGKEMITLDERVLRFWR